MTIYSHRKTSVCTSCLAEGKAGREWQAEASPIIEEIVVSRLIMKTDLRLGALRQDVCVCGVSALTVVPVIHLEGDSEGLGQHDDLDMITLPVHGFHLLLAEFLDSPPALSKVLKEPVLAPQAA